MLMYFTSGTTGMPKMAVHDLHLSPGRTSITGRAIGTTWTIRSLHLTVADTGWAKAGWGKTVWPVDLAGACHVRVRLRPLRAPPTCSRMLEKYQVTSFCAPPTIYRFLIKEDMKPTTI